MIAYLLLYEFIDIHGRQKTEFKYYFAINDTDAKAEANTMMNGLSVSTKLLIRMDGATNIPL